MLRFFRKIRQRLLTDNKFSKYLLYAIGEILLVVIGILIALQIDNWNENRKTRALELKTLKELRADLLQTRDDIRNDSVNFQKIIRSNEIILQHMRESLPYHDSLLEHFMWMEPFQTFSINQTTFNNIRQNGTNLITNDSIRIAISDFYTRPVNLYKEVERRVLEEHYENYFKPMIVQAFETVDNNTLIPTDYIAFIDNSDYKQVLVHNVRICTDMTRFQGYLLDTLEDLILKVDMEIQNFIGA